jgi:hypothetical protein
MTVKKAAPKPAVKKQATKPVELQKGNENVRGKEPVAKQAAAKPDAKSKAKTADAARQEMLKPALDSKKRQDHINRVATAIENDLVKIDPKNDEVQVKLTKDVDPEPLSAVKAEGLMEHKVGAGPYRILLMQDANATPSIAQRVEMAKAIQELHGKLPYIKSIELRKPEFYNAETQAKREPEAGATNGSGKREKAPKPEASSIPNGVPLKKICGEVNVDPKIARRILRSKGKKPGGRWEWAQAEVEGVKKLIKEEAAKLAK